jgi:hypothetical protein
VEGTQVLDQIILDLADVGKPESPPAPGKRIVRYLK